MVVTRHLLKPGMELKFQILCTEAVNHGDRLEMLLIQQLRSVLSAKIVKIIINTKKMLSKKKMRCLSDWSRALVHRWNRESMAVSLTSSLRKLILQQKEALTIKILEFNKLMVIRWMMATQVALIVERRVIYHYY